jgi:hypothetical protein
VSRVEYRVRDPEPRYGAKGWSQPQRSRIVYHAMFPLFSLAFQSLRVARAAILPRDKGKVSKWDVAWSLMRRNLKVYQTELGEREPTGAHLSESYRLTFHRVGEEMDIFLYLPASLT